VDARWTPESSRNPVDTASRGIHRLAAIPFIDRITHDPWSASYGTTWDDSSQGVEHCDGFSAAAVTEANTEEPAWYGWHASRRLAMPWACREKAGAFVHQQIIRAVHIGTPMRRGHRKGPAATVLTTWLTIVLSMDPGRPLRKS